MKRRMAFATPRVRRAGPGGPTVISSDEDDDEADNEGDEAAEIDDDGDSLPDLRTDTTEDEDEDEDEDVESLHSESTVCDDNSDVDFEKLNATVDVPGSDDSDFEQDQVIHLFLSIMFYRVLSRSRASNELGNFCCCWAKRLIGGAGHRDSPENLKMTRLKSTRRRQARQECRIGVLVGMARFELTTPASRRQCSTRLSYTPTGRNYNTTRIRVFKFVGLPKIRSIGSEPV